MKTSDVSVVIVTRNRLKALEMSLPLILAQSYPPSEILVVDSSDDPEPVKKLVAALETQTDIPLRYIASTPGMTKQRNVGLEQVSAPIVVFPDDDSLLFETCLEDIVRVYQADTEQALAGVTVEAAQISPLSARGDLPPASYARKSNGRFGDCLGRLYVWVERRVIPIPYTYLRAEILRGKSLPEAVAQLGCSLVADQEGFRMSFRTVYLRKAPFNECLAGYSLGEDIDVCYGLSEIGAIAKLNKPLIYHHEFPGARAGGFRRGVMQVVNLAYIVARHTDPGAQARKAFYPWIRLLIFQIVLRLRSSYQRDRLRGVLAARRQMGRLIETPRGQADAVYLSIMSEF